ncbi:Trypsin/chymotrypsin inhibitor [Bienertia sinuspersici]
MASYHFLLPTITTIHVTLLFLSTPTAANHAVLDIDGNPLEASSRYYVLTWGRGAAARGRPVSFYPADPSQKQITEGDEINISFGGPNYCRTNGVWQLTFDEKTMIPIMGGKRENCQQLDATQPGPNGVSFLSLVPIDNPLPFFGFVFKKVTTDDAASTSYY